MDVASGVVAERAQIEGCEHAERLHEHGALGPRRLAQDLPAREGRAHRRFEPGSVAGQIRGAQKPSDALGEPADRRRESVAAIETLARRGDAGCWNRATRPGVGLDEPPQGSAEGGLHEQLPHLGTRPPG